MTSSDFEAQTAPTIELELDRLRDLTRNGRHTEALAAAQALAATGQSSDAYRDILYLIATNQRCLNRINEALATLERLQKQHPGYSRLFQERGYCFVALRDARQAIDAFQRAVSFDAALPQSWSMLERLYVMTGDIRNAGVAARHAAVAAKVADVRVLIARQMYSQAVAELDSLLRSDSTNQDYLALFATTCALLGEHETASASYRKLLASAPGTPELHLPLAHSLKASGAAVEALESYRAALAARPGFGDVWWSLANLKTYRFSQDEITAMQAEEAASGAQPVDRYHLCFALGKALEDQGEFAQSWHYYERGNALKRAASPYSPHICDTNTSKQMEVCTEQFFAARTGFGVPDRDPVFVVGLPRSGSTLIEQILASHPLIEGTLELPDIQRIVLELQGRHPHPDGPRYPSVLTELGNEAARELAQRYLASTRAYRRTNRPLFIDKMPNNFRHIGLIHLMLPNATIIDVRREPMACCFSNLKQLFASGQEFTYGIEDVARYYRTYLDLMRHWDTVLPGRVLRVQYDDVVADLEGNVRRILDFCGLPFDPACVRFYNTRRSVSTPSSEQVRQPIFRESLDQWRNYEPWLGPLKDALGDAPGRYRD